MFDQIKTRSYRHFCRVCKREELVPALKSGATKNVVYPRCCGKAMAYIGTMDPAAAVTAK